jgi:hypothetical protein
MIRRAVLLFWLTTVTSIGCPIGRSSLGLQSGDYVEAGKKIIALEGLQRIDPHCYEPLSWWGKRMFWLEQVVGTAPKRAIEHALAGAMCSRHVGRRPGLINKDEPVTIEPALALRQASRRVRDESYFGCEPVVCAFFSASALLALWRPTTQPDTAPSLPWPAMEPAAPPTSAPLMQPLACAPEEKTRQITAVQSMYLFMGHLLLLKR